MFNENLYLFQIHDGRNIIDCSSYSDFLGKVRRIEEGGIGVKITIPGQTGSPWIMIDSSDFYFKSANNIKFPLTYTGADVKLSFGSFQRAIATLSTDSQGSTHKNHTHADDAFKILTFFISEAARFEIIEHACYVMFNDRDVCFNWTDWKPLLNSWSNISAYAAAPFTSTILNPQLRPVPIWASQRNIYDGYSTVLHHGTILSRLHGNTERRYLEMMDSQPDEPVSPGSPRSRMN